MNEKRSLTVPITRELHEIVDMVLMRKQEPRLRLADVVHGEPEVPVGPNARRGGNRRFAVNQRHQMADFGVGDRGLDKAQRRDIDGF